MSDHPIPLCVSPFAAYDYAARAFSYEVRDLGASEATRRYEPRRLGGTWWSPLFDCVLQTPTAVPHG